jgi:hypothetical protein
MNKMIPISALVFVIVLLYSCKDKSSNPDSQTPVSLSYEATKCLAHGLAKGTELDSVFTYSFTTDLVIDFSVWANCCPDSNRFLVSYTISNDTILISVADTARSLCHCICPYMIHADFMDLSKDHYVVRCRIGNNQVWDDPIHLVDVYRQR